MNKESMINNLNDKLLDDKEVNQNVILKHMKDDVLKNSQDDFFFKVFQDIVSERYDEIFLGTSSEDQLKWSMKIINNCINVDSRIQ